MIKYSFLYFFINKYENNINIFFFKYNLWYILNIFKILILIKFVINFEIIINGNI